MIQSVQLCATLNELGAGMTSAAWAERRLRVAGQPHHVADPSGLLGLDRETGTPIRLALARVEQLIPSGCWALLLPRPGRLGGLRGPASTTTLALQTGAIVVAHGGGIGWLPRPVGPAMQWLLVPVDPPGLPEDPATASRLLAQAMLDAEGALSSLDQPSGTRPDHYWGVRLGPAFDQRNQTLLDRAMGLHAACQAGLSQMDGLLDSHAHERRTRALTDLDAECLRAISSAVSWPAGAQIRRVAPAF